MNSKIIIVVVIAIIAIVVIAVVSSRGFKEGEFTELTPEVTLPEEEQSPGEEDILEKLMTDDDTETIDLVAVDGSDSSGKAYKLVEDGMLYHAVVADMPDPSGDQKCEGWIVRPEPLEFFSTGVMEKEGDSWVLEFEAARTFPEYQRVAITLETTVDPVPEKHVIEGDFSVSEEEEEVGSKEESVLIVDFAYSPSKIIVKEGTTVTWENRDSAPHTVTAEGVFDSGSFSPGETFSYTFEEAGTYDYICTIHPFMEGQIVVE